MAELVAEEVEEIEWSLDNVPVEILLEITKHLPSRFLLQTLKLVSKYFNEILSNELTWQIRQKKKWGHFGSYPPISTPPGFKYSRACVKIEEQLKLWTQNEPNLTEFHNHIACVDAVHLFKKGNKLATGSRDRSICLYDLETGRKLIQKQNAHLGWIWSICNHDNNLISSSWDCLVKIWDLEKEFLNTNSYKCKSAIISLANFGNLIAAGTFDKFIEVFDIKSGENCFKFKAHKKCVLAVGMDQKFIISCGEDGFLCFFDKVAGKIFKRFKLPSLQESNKPNYAKSLSFAGHSISSNPLEMFYVGDVQGSVHLFDLKNFELIKSWRNIHTRSIQGIFHTLGSIFTCSSDGEMKIHEPSSGFNLIKKFGWEKVELPQVHCLNERVALAGGDGVVRVWTASI